MKENRFYNKVYMEKVRVTINPEKQIYIHGVDIRTFNKLKKIGVYDHVGKSTQWVDIDNVTFFLKRKEVE